MNSFFFWGPQNPPKMPRRPDTQKKGLVLSTGKRSSLGQNWGGGFMKRGIFSPGRGGEGRLCKKKKKKDVDGIWCEDERNPPPFEGSGKEFSRDSGGLGTMREEKIIKSEKGGTQPGKFFSYGARKKKKKFRLGVFPQRTKCGIATE